jgi:hypothetical protein
MSAGYLEGYMVLTVPKSEGIDLGHLPRGGVAGVGFATYAAEDGIQVSTVGAFGPLASVGSGSIVRLQAGSRRSGGPVL